MEAFATSKSSQTRRSEGQLVAHLVEIVVHLWPELLNRCGNLYLQLLPHLFSFVEFLLLPRYKRHNQRTQRPREGGQKSVSEAGLGQITHLRTSIPASPNLRAKYPMIGREIMTRNGVQILHFNGALALIATIVARKA